MVCIHCSGETAVTNSRPQKRLNQIWRRRRCLSCGALFTTEESVQLLTAWRVQAPNGKLEAFSRDKLFLSVLMSCQHRQRAVDDAGALTDSVIKKLMALRPAGPLASTIIAQTVQITLNRFDKVASMHYNAFHQA